MVILPDLADRFYTIMVQTIGAPDIDYRRWSFMFAVTELKVKKYTLDSRLGVGAVFANDPTPQVICAANEITPERTQITLRVNQLIAEIAQPVAAKKVRRVRVKGGQRRVAIPVQQIDKPIGDSLQSTG